MHASREPPWLAGSSGAYPSELPTDRSGGLLWEDAPFVTSGGDWRPEELRTATHPLGRVVVFGSCLADNASLDASLAQALEQGETQALGNLPGSYTTLLFDRHGGLTALADLANQYPLFYRRIGGGVAFSNQAAMMRGASFEPDATTLAAQVGTPWAVDLLSGRSPLVNVHRVEAATALRVDPDGRTSSSVYENFALSSDRTFEGASEALREALLAATIGRAALGRRVSSDFSGGLDSTSLAFLMSHQLNNPLMIVTRHAPDIPIDDTEHVRKYLALQESIGRFDHHIYETPGAATMYADLLNVPAGDVPAVSIRDRALLLACHQYLRSQGSELHMDGNGADAIFDMSHRQYVGGLARQGRLPAFMRAVWEAARAEGDSPVNLLADAHRASRLTPRRLLREMAQALEQPRQLALMKGRMREALFGSAAAPNWLTVKAAKELAELALDRAAEVPFDKESDLANYRTYGDIRSLGMALHSDMQLAAEQGLRVHSPYMDNDVLRACFSIAAHERVNPWEFKAILGRALQGLVPEQITSRPSKGNYTRHAFKGLRAASPVFAHLLRDSRLADLGIIEPNRVKEALGRTYAGRNLAWVSFDAFVAAEIWLRAAEGEQAGSSYGGIVEPTATVGDHTVAEGSRESLNKDTSYGLLPGVIIVIRPTGATVLNIQKETYHRLNKPACQLLEALQDGGSVQGALDILQEKYPAVSQSRLQDRVGSTISKMLKQGIIAEGAPTFDFLEGWDEMTGVRTDTMVRQPAESYDLGLKDYALAISGFAAATALRRLPFARQIRVIEKLHQRCLRPADPKEAQRTLAAVRRIAEPYIGRAACLELAMATVLAEGFRRRKVHLVLGTKTDPDGFHAWAETDGVPIRTVADEQIKRIYQPLLKV